MPTHLFMYNIGGSILVTQLPYRKKELEFVHLVFIFCCQKVSRKTFLIIIWDFWDYITIYFKN